MAFGLSRFDHAVSLTQALFASFNMGLHHRLALFSSGAARPIHVPADLRYLFPRFKVSTRYFRGPGSRILATSKGSKGEHAAKESTMTATILAVDDDRGFRSVLHDLLNQDPEFQLIGEAENGEQAVRSTRELHPDVVLMDITMPQVNGFEATRRIKSDNPATKVIILTVHSERHYERAALENGADAFIAKKRLGSELLSTIHEVLSKPANDALATNASRLGQSKP
jgi:CheY-like chemotaxis protein